MVHHRVSLFSIAIKGAKQGGVLSPVLFCVYIDGVLVAQSKTEVGCLSAIILYEHSPTPMTSFS